MMRIRNQAWRYTALLLALSLLLSLAACGGKETSKATSMHLKRTEGTVAVSDDGGKDVALLDNLGLYSGYGVRTRSESYAWIDLDDMKLTKMDQDSRVTIEKNGKELEIRVRSGGLFFNVTEPLEDDETLNIRTSTLLVGIRGTCGWVEDNDGLSRVYLLEGKVKCSAEGESVQVRAGEMAGLTEDGELTVTEFTVRDIPDYVLEEVVDDEDLALAILEDSGIDVLNPPEPNNITGAVTDRVTGRPLGGVTVVCEGGEVSVQAGTDENGVYQFSDLPAGEYQIHASRDGYEESLFAGVVLDGTTANLDLTLRPFYAQVYADYLLAAQEVDEWNPISYPRGQGRFALLQMTDDDIPELLMIGTDSRTLLFTYHEGEVQYISLVDGSTILGANGYWDALRIINENVFAMRYENGECAIYKRIPDGVFSYVLYANMFTWDGNYYVNEYDESMMLENDYEYRWSYEDHEVSQSEYEQAPAAYGIDETNLRLTEADLHYITPDDIARVFGEA